MCMFMYIDIYLKCNRAHIIIIILFNLKCNEANMYFCFIFIIGKVT